jgi:3-oxoacyl-[acyl-carrier-protein] synthase II
MPITTRSQGRKVEEVSKSVGADQRDRYRRVVVTGMGCVTPLGSGADRFWKGLVAGRSGVDRLSLFDPQPYGTKIAGQVRDFRPADFLSQREITGSARCTQLALASARMAIEDSRLLLNGWDTSRVGVFVGSSVGTAEYLAENHAVFLEKGIRRVHPLFPALSYSGVVATQLAITLGVRGPAMCISSACTSATDAIGMAWMHIRQGLIDRAIVGGTEAPLTPILFAAFDRLGVMSRENDNPARASRPFAADRDGFVMSEGAGVCILEAAEVASERGAPALVELAGYAATSDGFHPFSPLPTGEEGARAVRLALDQAAIAPEHVDYVNAHAIGSRSNDPIELDILRNVFRDGLSLVPVSAIKSMIGHTMGAAGALELIACVRAIQTQTLPPTINLASDDPKNLGLDLVADEPRKAKVDIALSPTFGFGSRNAVLVVRGYGTGSSP